MSISQWFRENSKTSKIILMFFIVMIFSWPELRGEPEEILVSTISGSPSVAAYQDGSSPFLVENEHTPQAAARPSFGWLI